MNIPTRITVFGVAVSFTVLLSACGATTPTATTSTSSTPTSTPAGAGMMTTSGGMMSSSAGMMTSSTGMMTTGGTMSSAGGMMSGTTTDIHNDADIAFAQQMIVHHQGAITMSDLAPTRASSAQVKQLAVDIKAAQGPEITQMTGWLNVWAPAMNSMTTATPTGGMGGMGNTITGSVMSMPGMMSDDQMTALTAASGIAFDKLFLQLMITHHQGALTMAQTEKATGENPDALELADLITASQTSQISTMQELLKGM